MRQSGNLFLGSGEYPDMMRKGRGWWQRAGPVGGYELVTGEVVGDGCARRGRFWRAGEPELGCTGSGAGAGWARRRRRSGPVPEVSVLPTQPPTMPATVEIATHASAGTVLPNADRMIQPRTSRPASPIRPRIAGCRVVVSSAHLSPGQGPGRRHGAGDHHQLVTYPGGR